MLSLNSFNSDLQHSSGPGTSEFTTASTEHGEACANCTSVSLPRCSGSQTIGRCVLHGGHAQSLVSNDMQNGAKCNFQTLL